MRNSVVDIDPLEAVQRLLVEIGEDPDREGLKDTPRRVLKSYNELFSGYGQKVESLMTVFEDDTSNEMVILTDIEFYSFCEHHMLPFFGKAHVAYLPMKRVIGISKLARIVDMFSRRLQIQERLTSQITAALDKHLKPLGSACVIEAQHFCMRCRGVQKQNSSMITSSLTGVFKNEEVRAEFLGFIK
jgi:GTP cyclohydrolase I